MQDRSKLSISRQVLVTGLAIGAILSAAIAPAPAEARTRVRHHRHNTVRVVQYAPAPMVNITGTNMVSDAEAARRFAEYDARVSLQRNYVGGAWGTSWTPDCCWGMFLPVYAGGGSTITTQINTPVGYAPAASAPVRRRTYQAYQ